MKPSIELTPVDASMSRRDLLRTGGATVAGVALLGGCQTATDINPLIPPVAKVVEDTAQVRPTPAPQGRAQFAMAGEDGTKPTYVADRRDPVAYSLADNLFWNDIMMEHALFFTMLMPGPDLAGPRGQAEQFQRIFARQLELSRSIDRDNYVRFNQETMDHVRRFSDFKKTMRQDQDAGRMHSLVWPLFFEHTAREADRFSKRLGMYSSGNIEFERAEVIDFWSKTMGEHAAFMAHLLDPKEKLLIGQARKLERAFENPATNINPRATRDGDPMLKAAEEILDFKSIAEKGIKSGRINSIVRPELADHVRREAVRFIDELKRASAVS